MNGRLELGTAPVDRDSLFGPLEYALVHQGVGREVDRPLRRNNPEVELGLFGLSPLDRLHEETGDGG